MDRVPRLERIALVVDDDIFVLSALAELLSEDGYDVHTASNGFSALRMATECRPSVVLLDLALPERGGTEVLAELRGDPATRDVAIVVVTGNPQLISEAQLAATDGLISKPFDTSELMATVQHAVMRASTRRAEVAPVAAISHTPLPVRQRRAPGVRHTRGRR
jgi:two-component system, OmpR family, KDP operon response regulator KdpE